MKLQQKQQAQQLYIDGQSKSDIANTLGVDRRTIHLWVKDGEWDNLRQSTQCMPIVLTDKCYHLLDRHLDTMITANEDPDRNSLQTLSTYIRALQRLGARVSVSESAQLLNEFVEHVSTIAPHLAADIAGLAAGYIAKQANRSRKIAEIKRPLHHTPPASQPLSASSVAIAPAAAPSLPSAAQPPSSGTPAPARLQPLLPSPSLPALTPIAQQLVRESPFVVSARTFPDDDVFSQACIIQAIHLTCLQPALATVSQPIAAKVTTYKQILHTRQKSNIPKLKALYNEIIKYPDAISAFKVGIKYFPDAALSRKAG